MFRLRVILLFAFVASIRAYTFKCFQRNICTCNTDEEFIDCEGWNLKKFPDMDFKRLRGFSRINLRLNLIENLGVDERTLIRKLPDLKIIDLNGNPLNCEKVAHFKKIIILSKCLGLEPGIKSESPKEEAEVEESKKEECLYKNYFCGWREKMERIYLELYAHAHHIGGKVLESSRKIPILKNYLSRDEHETELRVKNKIEVVQ